MTHSQVDESKLETVRKLIAKAQSTNFEGEAEALMAKAQELMVQYSIEEAMLAKAQNRSVRIVSKPIRIYNPYMGAQTQLVLEICHSLKLQAIIIQKTRMLRTFEVFGMADQVEFAELLITSILQQLASERQRAAKDGRSTGSAWQNNFGYGYVTKVAHRVNEFHNQATQAQTTDNSMALALYDAGKAAEDAMRAKYTKVKTMRSDPGPNDREWGAAAEGMRRGENADISGGRKNVGGGTNG